MLQCYSECLRLCFQANEYFVRNLIGQSKILGNLTAICCEINIQYQGAEHYRQTSSCACVRQVLCTVTDTVKTSVYNVGLAEFVAFC